MPPIDRTATPAIARTGRLAAFGCLTVIALASCTRPAPLPSSSAAIFYVATNGNDAWTGRSPNAARNDGPFLTVARALQAVRQTRQNPGSSDRSAKIILRQGIYFLREPLALAPEDSNLEISTYRQEKPTLSGGRPISGWKQQISGGKTIWVAELPEARDGHWVFRELWVNGRPAIRARHPNQGYLAIGALPDKAPEWTQGQSRFAFREGDLKAWPTVTNAEVVAMSRWVESRLPVVNVAEKDRLVSFGKRSVFELAPGDPYYIEGALELLDQPGE